MAKLYFRFGTVGSAKTLNLLAVSHNYKQQGKRVILIKPKLDTRFGAGAIKSRAGLEQEADLLVSEDSILPHHAFIGASCVLIDEAQFVSTTVVDQLREIAHRLGVPVICYGLRTDFRGQLFAGARRLLELADSIEEIKTTCAFCNKKAIMNLKHLNGLATLAGPQVDLGAEEKYFPACYSCYRSQLEASGEDAAQYFFGNPQISGKAA